MTIIYLAAPDEPATAPRDERGDATINPEAARVRCRTGPGRQPASCSVLHLMGFFVPRRLHAGR